MASDSRVSCGNYIVPGENKKCFYTQGALVGIAGDADEQVTLNPVFEELAHKEQLPEWLEKLATGGKAWQFLIVFTKAPRVVWLAGVKSKDDDTESYCYSTTVEKGQGLAIGSGDAQADMAMSLGKTAGEAVEAAMEFDVYTGGTITEYRL
jgi:ATP-dependent protease HslVU (ClpYQ) peptidase subunit